MPPPLPAPPTILLLTLLWSTLTSSNLADAAAAAYPIPLGSSLSPSDDSSSSSSSAAATAAWISSNGTFRFAFYSPPDTHLGLSVGVLFHTDGIPTTAAWSALPQHASAVDPSSTFTLSPDGDLILADSSRAVAWSSGTAGRGVAGATMQDDGNFVLRNSSGAIIWQSFDHPSDTLVQGQVLGPTRSLSSFGGSSQYYATMEATGNLSLSYVLAGPSNTTTNETFWSSGTAGGNGSYAMLSDNSSVALRVYNAQGDALPEAWSPNDYTNTDHAYVRRVTLDGDGNLRIYSWVVGSPPQTGWTVGWQALEDQCLVHGFCGPNGICTYNDTGVACSCAGAAGFRFIDPLNPRLGCASPSDNGGRNCKSGKSMVQLNHTELFLSGTKSFNYDDNSCQSACLNSDLCTAATALNDGSGKCLWLSDPSLNFSGYHDLSLSATSYLKFCGVAVDDSGSDDGNPDDGGRAGSVPIGITVAAVVGALGGFLLLEVVVIWICCRQNPRFSGYGGSRFRSQYSLLEYASGAPVQLSYGEVRKATKQFTEKLGEGGFGAVYKGSLAMAGGGMTLVAVKRLQGFEQGERQFRMEVAIIGSTHHLNLVRLCGFCAEGKHRLIIYEYMENRSLDLYLFGGEDEAYLDWATRFQILLGAARGITYLHQECRDCIIHCDIKPENILLDKYFTAKVSDFGLAKLLSHVKSKDAGRHVAVTKLVRGTRGYLAPEWRSNLPITAKSDVFSFGMVVLETISGRKGFEEVLEGGGRESSGRRRRRGSFCEWAYYEYFGAGAAAAGTGGGGGGRKAAAMDAILDRRIVARAGARGGREEDESVVVSEFERAMRVAYWCMQVQPSSRPSMSRVIQMLEGSLDLGIPPPIPMLFGELLTTSQDDDDAAAAAAVRAAALQQEMSSPPNPTRSAASQSSFSVGTGGTTTGPSSFFSSSPASAAHHSLLFNH